MRATVLVMTRVLGFAVGDLLWTVPVVAMFLIVVLHLTLAMLATLVVVAHIGAVGLALPFALVVYVALLP